MLKASSEAIFAIIVKNVFSLEFNYGVLVKCLNCGKIIRNLDFFLDLPLDIPVQKAQPPILFSKSKPKIGSNKNDPKEKEQIFCEKNNDSFGDKLEGKKFSLINTMELTESNFPNFDKDNNELYEPDIDLDNLKSSQEKVILISFYLLIGKSVETQINQT